MAIVNPRIHIICGICGCKDMLSYKIKKNFICDNDGIERDGVAISCGNCDSVTGLDEVMGENLK